MSFYCIYCNKDRSGKRNSPEQQTREHFIPQSIGGQWVIPVCKECNNHAGSTCDAFFAQVSYTYEVYRRDIVEIDGVAELLDGRKIPAHFRYQTADAEHPYLLECKELNSQSAINKSSIKALWFLAQQPKNVIATYPAVAKMALGSAYYLERMHANWKTPINSIFLGLIFADIRKIFLGMAFKPGGTGNGNGVEIKSLLSNEAEALLLSRESPTIRRHYISMEDFNSSLKITLCLYSMYFWEVTIPNVSIGLCKLQKEILLPNLAAVDPVKAADLMHHDKNTWIKILIYNS